MNTTTLVMLAVGLAMDAFAVSISNSMCYGGLEGRQMVVNSACFGLFQGIMPVAGFFGGMLLGRFIQSIDHWVALVLLGIIGGKMLIEGLQQLRRGDDDCPEDIGSYTTKTMLVQALATSIDALAVGIGFAALAVNIWFASGLIAVITFVCCLAGAYLGKLVGSFLGKWAQMAGGLILVGIGINIFVEHMAEHGMG